MGIKGSPTTDQDHGVEWGPHNIQYQRTLARRYLTKWAMTSGQSFHGKTQNNRKSKRILLHPLWRAVRSKANVALFLAKCAIGFCSGGLSFPLDGSNGTIASLGACRPNHWR